MKTKYNFNYALILGLALFYSLSIFHRLYAQDYLNINASGGNYSSLLSDVKEITFDVSGNATFTKSDDSFVTLALNTITDLTISTTSNGGSPLPVELVSFSANMVDGNINIKWTTATEVNNYGFEIERNLNPHLNPLQGGEGAERQGWVAIGFVEGNGNSNSPKEYSFVDDKTYEVFNNLGGLSAELKYRLKQIDFDGKFEYSEIITVETLDATSLPTEFALEQNYPNPFNPTTTIKYSIPNTVIASEAKQSQEMNVTLKVYDILGNEVAVLVNEQKSAGKYEVNFNASNLASGIYFTRITAGSYTSLIKMLMLK